MAKKTPSEFEQIVTHVYLDAEELRSRLAPMVENGTLTEDAAREIVTYARDLTGIATDRVIPCFNGADFHSQEVAERFGDLGLAVNNLLAVLERNMDSAGIRYYADRLTKNIKKLALEYESRGLLHGFGDRAETETGWGMGGC